MNMGHVDRYVHKDMDIKGCFKRSFAKSYLTKKFQKRWMGNYKNICNIYGLKKTIFKIYSF